MRLKCQAPSPALLGGAFRHDDGPASAFPDRQADDPLLGKPHPIDKGTLDPLRLPVLATLLGQRIRGKRGLWQSGLSPVIAPGNSCFDLLDVRVEKDGQ